MSVRLLAIFMQQRVSVTPFIIVSEIIKVLSSELFLKVFIEGLRTWSERSLMYQSTCNYTLRQRHACKIIMWLRNTEKINEYREKVTVFLRKKALEEKCH